MNDNGTYETTGFLEAAFLRARGVLYVGTHWPTPQQAIFVFRRPSDAILSAWQRGDDKISARALQDSMDFLRDQLKRRGDRNGG